jgi:hypothetical protein
VTLSVVSLIAAGLFVRSARQAHELDPGFETRRLGAMVVNPGQGGYDQPRAEQFCRSVLEKVARIPGLRSACCASKLPLFGRFQRSVFPEGLEDQEREKGVLVQTNIVEPGFFETFRCGAAERPGLLDRRSQAKRSGGGRRTRKWRGSSGRARTPCQRFREIGLRMALGARRSDVLFMVLTNAMVLVGVGAGIGLAAAFAVTRAVKSLVGDRFRSPPVESPFAPAGHRWRFRSRTSLRKIELLGPRPSLELLPRTFARASCAQESGLGRAPRDVA